VTVTHIKPAAFRKVYTDALEHGRECLVRDDLVGVETVFVILESVLVLAADEFDRLNPQTADEAQAETADTAGVVVELAAWAPKRNRGNR
jgi:hypothetical protein